MDEAGSLLVDAVSRAPAGQAPFRVLVADDEDDIRDLVCVAVAKAGCTVAAEVADGAQALSAARTGLPDLAILDVNMPGATGLEVCTALRGDPATAGIRILLLSAGASPDEVARGLAAGADAYLAKPFGIKALVQQVRALAEQTSPAGRSA
ncbi:MAG: response regulator receiver protein [Blastococcus sp.]|nr:response regulator receiver protein [Blastococcus sp.]